MKKTFLFFILFLGVIKLQAQENIVKASLIYGNAGVQYERSLSQHFSVAAQAGFGFINVSSNYVTNDFTTGLGYYLEGRYYFSSTRDRLTGWHIGPSINVTNTKGKKTDNTYKTNVYSISAGRQWIFESHFTLEFMLAVSYQDKQSSRTSEVFSDSTLPVSPTAGVSFGYAF